MGIGPIDFQESKLMKWVRRVEFMEDEPTDALQIVCLVFRSVDQAQEYMKTGLPEGCRMKQLGVPFLMLLDGDQVNKLLNPVYTVDLEEL